MSGHSFTEKSFAFFEELAENNNKEWFNAHKVDFQTYVEDPFLDLLEALTSRLTRPRSRPSLHHPGQSRKAAGFFTCTWMQMADSPGQAGTISRRTP
jgi:uncharacterized protein (DUF2461 family)